jgi:RND family efflux transporter MFP subunit
MKDEPTKRKLANGKWQLDYGYDATGKNPRRQFDTEEAANKVLDAKRRGNTGLFQTTFKRPGGNTRAGGAPSRLKIVMIALLVVVAVAIAIGTGIQTRLQAEGQLARSTRMSAIPSVLITHPRAGAAGGEVELPGNTQPFSDTPIYARVSGYLKSWHVDIGARVKQGELLAEIDAPEVDQQLLQARADLKNAQVNLEFARITADRYEVLIKTASVSQQETDQTVSDFHSRQALVDASQANVHRLEELQGFERIYAPFDGVITARNTDIGALIQAGDNTGPKELFHVAALDRLRIYVSVPENYVAAAKSGSKVALTFDSLFPGETFPGTVVRSANAIDPNSRTLNVEVDMDNSSGRVLPGAYAFAHLPTTSSARAVTIPANALLFRAEGLRVGVVRNDRVNLVPVTIGHDYGSSVEILSSLVAADAIIVDPSDSLESGDSVQVTLPRQ